MLAKRFVLLLGFAVCTLSSAALAQKADAAFVVGASFVSDSKATFAVPCLIPEGCPLSPTFLSTVQVDHQVVLEGTLGLQLLNAKVASLHLEVPIAGIPSQTVHFANFSTAVAHMSSVYVTPGFRLKLLPSSPIAPFVSLGGGWARYAVGGGTTNKGAIEYGGGLDFKTRIPGLGFRGEVRDFVTGDPNFGPIGSFVGSSTQSGLHRHNILAGGGVVLRF